MSPRTIALGSALLLCAIAQPSAHAQTVIAWEFVLPPRAIATSTALVASKQSEDGRTTDAVLRPPSSVLSARPSSPLGPSSLVPRPSNTIALSAGTFEKKPLTDPGIFPLDATAGATSTLGQRVNDAMTSLFHGETGAAGLSVVNPTGLPQLPTMNYEDR